MSPVNGKEPSILEELQKESLLQICYSQELLVRTENLVSLGISGSPGRTRTSDPVVSREKQKPNWTIKYWCNDSDVSVVEEWFDELTKEQLKSVAKEMKLLEICGNQLRLPHSRSLKKGLFELRERTYGYRIYYRVLISGNAVMYMQGMIKVQRNTN